MDSEGKHILRLIFSSSSFRGDSTYPLMAYVSLALEFVFSFSGVEVEGGIGVCGPSSGALSVSVFLCSVVGCLLLT